MRSANVSQSELRIMVATKVDLQTVLWGCPGGSNAKEDASTTRKPCTPITRALESTTAMGSVRLPILPVQGVSIMFLDK